MPNIHRNYSRRLPPVTTPRMSVHKKEIMTRKEPTPTRPSRGSVSEAPSRFRGKYTAKRKNSDDELERPQFFINGFTVRRRGMPEGGKLAKKGRSRIPSDESPGVTSAEDERETVIQLLPLSSDDDDDSDEEEIELQSNSDGESELKAPPTKKPSEPPSELLDILHSRYYVVPHPPFLRRNLRRCFHIECIQERIRTRPPELERPMTVDVIYIYHTPDTGKRAMYATTMREWYCPICDWHRPFATREMLMYHLARDHDDLIVECHRVHIVDEDNLGASGPLWRLQLSLPRHIGIPVAGLSSPAIEEREVLAQSNDDPINLPMSNEAAETIQLDHDEPDELLVDLEQQVLHPTPAPEPPQSQYEPTPSPEVEEQHQGQPDADVDVSAQTDALSALRLSPSVSSILAPIPNSLDAFQEDLPQHKRSCTPPPQHCPYGPAAQPPFVPFRSFDGGPNIYYSCRPGGPRVYDLLSTLSMEKFGVLANDIIDQEEVLLENEEIQDELKVMQALWARWVRVNRQRFIANHFEGTKAFVEEYWKMIHYAAGYQAFKDFCIMILVLNRYINDTEIVKVLAFYREKTEMDTWYK